MGYQYAGLSAVDHIAADCYVGKAFGKYGKAPSESECEPCNSYWPERKDMKCGGDRKITDKRNAVYNLSVANNAQSKWRRLGGLARDIGVLNSGELWIIGKDYPD